jgi:hypothetical protein
MSDPLVDNKHMYLLEFYFIHIFSWITKIIFILFFIGFFSNKPATFLEANFVVKVLIGAFLVYRFNSYRNKSITFTELDRKAAYSAGLYIIFLSFADLIDGYTNEIRSFVLPYTKPMIRYIDNLINPTKLTKIYVD